MPTGSDFTLNFPTIREEIFHSTRQQILHRLIGLLAVATMLICRCLIRRQTFPTLWWVAALAVTNLTALDSLMMEDTGLRHSDLIFPSSCGGRSKSSHQSRSRASLPGCRPLSWFTDTPIKPIKASGSRNLMTVSFSVRYFEQGSTESN